MYVRCIQQQYLGEAKSLYFSDQANQKQASAAWTLSLEELLVCRWWGCGLHNRRRGRFVGLFQVLVR